MRNLIHQVASEADSGCAQGMKTLRGVIEAEIGTGEIVFSPNLSEEVLKVHSQIFLG